MGIVLFCNHHRNQFYPLSTTKAIASLRMGILTIQERWALATGELVHIHTADYLSSLYPAITAGEHFWIDSTVVFSADLWAAICQLLPNEALVDEHGLIAGRTTKEQHEFDSIIGLACFSATHQYQAERLHHAHEMVKWNDYFIKTDFQLVTKNRTSQPIPQHVTAIHPENIFIEQGATISYSILNASTGYIYIGENATIMEGCLIRGGLVLGNNSLLKMGSKIYGATSFGPNCVGGGEIKNVIMQGNSNKAHDGYLGDSVIGEWCNFGAGSSNSNVKNTGGTVHLWSEAAQTYLAAGEKFGLLMGDYSRVAINSSINTGSVIGVCCNVFGAGLLPKHIQNFSWGVNEWYQFSKALQDIENWKKMKHQTIKEAEATMLKHIFETK